MTGDLSTTDTLERRLVVWADARDRRNPNGHGKTGTALLREAAAALARLRQDSSAAGTELRDALRYVDECFEHDGPPVTEALREAKRTADAWALRNADARYVSALIDSVLPPLCDAAGVVRAALAADADTPKAADA